MASPRRRIPRTNYLWDSRLGGTGRYVDKATGRIVSETIVNQALESGIDKAKQKMTASSIEMANGNITIGEWQAAMRDSMQIVHTQTAALTKGGWMRMSPADWGATGQFSKEQYKFLETFATELETGKYSPYKLNGEISGNFLRRVELYGDAANNTAWAMRDREARSAGADMEIRILDDRAQHCDCCPGEAGHWEPLGELLPIGQCDCGPRCRCEKRYGRRLEDGSIQEL